MDDTLHSGLHCNLNQVNQSTYIDGPIDIFQPPWSGLRGNIVHSLDVLYGAFEGFRLGQIARDDFDACQFMKAARVLYGSYHSSHFIATFQQQIDKMAA